MNNVHSMRQKAQPRRRGRGASDAARWAVRTIAASRRLLRFRTRTWLIAVTVACFGLAFWKLSVDAALSSKPTIIALSKRGVNLQMRPCAGFWWKSQFVLSKDVQYLVDVVSASKFRQCKITDFALLRELNQVETLDLTDSKFDDACLPYLKHSVNLLELRLKGTDLHGRNLTVLEKLPRIRILDLSSTHVCDDAVWHVRHLQQLRQLNVSGTKVTDAGLRVLRGLATLKQLNVSATRIHGPGLVDIRNCQSLSKLDLSKTGIADQHLEHLRPLKNLRQLSLRHTAITGPGLVWMARLPNLRRIDLACTPVVDEGLVQLKHARRLEFIDLFDTAVSISSLETLIDSLPRIAINRNTRLR